MRRGVEAGGRAARAATLAVLAVGYGAAIGLNWPGHLSFDSVVQLADGRAGAYHSWHPPLMAWLLGLGDALVPGAGLFVVLQATLLFGALAGATLARPRVGWAAPIVAALIAASPLVVVWQGVVWKDVLFADLAVAAFLALSVGAARGAYAFAPAAMLAFPLLGAAALVRQNGILVLLGGAAALGWSLARERGRLAGSAFATAALAFTLAGVAMADHALMERRVDAPGPAAQLDSLRTYDLAGVLAREPKTSLADLPPTLAAELRRAAATLYDPVRIDEMQADLGLQHAMGGAGPALARQWFTTVREHPLTWLRHRAAAFGEIVLTPSLELCRTDFTGVDGDPQRLRALGIKAGWSPRDLALAHYAAAFHGPPVYAHWSYALLALGLTVWLGRRRADGDAAVVALLISALAFTASFAVIGVACDYRYLYALDLATMAAAFHAALGRPAARALRPLKAARTARKAARPTGPTRKVSTRHGRSAQCGTPRRCASSASHAPVHRSKAR